MSGPGSASDSQGAYNVAYVAALRSEQNKRHRKRLQVRTRRLAAGKHRAPPGESPPPAQPLSPCHLPNCQLLPQSAEAQVESELEELAAEVAAARREGAALDVVHRSLIATERHQCDMLQVLQLADLQAARAGVERPARRPQVAAPAAAGLKAGLMHVVSEWSARAAALVQKGAYAIVTWGGYVPTDADMRCAGQRSAWSGGAAAAACSPRGRRKGVASATLTPAPGLPEQNTNCFDTNRPRPRAALAQEIPAGLQRRGGPEPTGEEPGCLCRPPRAVAERGRGRGRDRGGGAANVRSAGEARGRRG